MGIVTRAEHNQNRQVMAGTNSSRYASRRPLIGITDGTAALKVVTPPAPKPAPAKPLYEAGQTFRAWNGKFVTLRIVTRYLNRNPFRGYEYSVEIDGVLHLWHDEQGIAWMIEQFNVQMAALDAAIREVCSRRDYAIRRLNAVNPGSVGTWAGLHLRQQPQRTFALGAWSGQEAQTTLTA